MENLTPKKIVQELDKYIVGQIEAKRAVAIAIRNRWRRQQLSKDIRHDVMPKNIIMSGPTGVGKTEIARRLSSLIGAPFLKVEATKFTEVGYHGRDVDSIIRDLLDIAIGMVRNEKVITLQKKILQKVENRILEALFKKHQKSDKKKSSKITPRMIKETFKKKLRSGELEDIEIEISIEQKVLPMVEVISSSPMDPMGMGFQDIMDRFSSSFDKSLIMSVQEARQHLEKEESEQILNKEEVQKSAIERVEEMGIVFIDEIDKISGAKSAHGPDVSREGVQRDLLPLIEGTIVTTRHGLVRTDHILFIAAGAFYTSKPSDLIPELQGRFPIRVELSDLSEKDLYQILTEPKNALVKQYKALLQTEKISLQFTKSALQGITKTAVQVNQSTQNIGARRLHTIMEKLLEEVLFEAPYAKKKKISVDAKYVNKKLAHIVSNQDLSHFIL